MSDLDAEDMAEIATAIDRRLTKWRKRELASDDYPFPLWHGINRIRQGICEKPAARAALLALVASGRAERVEMSNGIFWRGGLRDVIDVRKSA